MQRSSWRRMVPREVATMPARSKAIILSIFLPTPRPGVPFSIINPQMPMPLSFGSSVPYTANKSATGALVTKVFVPSIISRCHKSLPFFCDASAHRENIRPGVWLADAIGPDETAVTQAGKIFPLLLVGAVLQQRDRIGAHVGVDR